MPPDDGDPVPIGEPVPARLEHIGHREGHFAVKQAKFLLVQEPIN